MIRTLALLMLFPAACRSKDLAQDTAPTSVDADADGYAADIDCDDEDPSIHPDAVEVCDGLDNDCSGEADDGLGSLWYADADADGFGDPAVSQESCEDAEGYVADATDCDDSDPLVFPGADELCNDLDDDCDGDVDEEAVDAITLYSDEDEDGFGDASQPVTSCEHPAAYVGDSSDCDDGDASVYPGAPELCDGLDNSCDGVVDEGVTTTFYADADADGYGDAGVSLEACEQPTGAADNDQDCDDNDAAVNPAAEELCNGVDDDCDGGVDLGAADASAWFADADSDGYGDAAASLSACDQPTGHVADDTDCDDAEPTVNPGGTEVCDGLDNDCDGDVDVGAADASDWYADADADGYGDAAVSLSACTQPSAHVADDTDCDDAEPLMNPGETEVCDGLDNDCDGSVDPGFDDTDGDGTPNCVDASIYDYDFDDNAWTNWSAVDLSGGNSPNWSMSNGQLSERSNAANSVALGPDLGPLNTYTITVETRSAGAANNAAAIVFGYQGTGDYWMARWLDPNGYYSSYSNGGRVDLYHCVAGTCTVLATDDGSRDLTAGYSDWVTLSVSIDGMDLSVSLDGVLLVEHTHSSAPIGADAVGLYTFDNDSTIYYDNFVVTWP